MKRQIIEIKKIEVNDKLYPRTKYSESIVKDYAKKMDGGKQFPPVYLALYKKKYILCDGLHRVEAMKSRGEKYINAEIKDNFTDMNQILVASYRANENHGLRLSQADKLKVAYTMADLEFAEEQITELTGIEIGTFRKEVLGKFRKDTIKQKIKQGKVPAILKDTLKKEKVGKLISKEQEFAMQKQYRTEWQLDELERIYEYFKTEKLDTDDKRVEKAITKIKKVLKKQCPKL